jgi:MFS superfamily sulfate permease-like transporter
LGAAYFMVLADVLTVPVACLPMAWARRRRGAGWLYGLYLLVLATVVLSIVGLAIAAQRSNSSGALVVVVYAGVALVASSARLGYEAARVFGRKRPAGSGTSRGCSSPQR